MGLLWRRVPIRPQPLLRADRIDQGHFVEPLGPARSPAVNLTGGARSKETPVTVEQKLHARRGPEADRTHEMRALRKERFEVALRPHLDGRPFARRVVSLD